MDAIRIESIRSSDFDQFFNDLEIICRNADNDPNPMSKNYKFTNWYKNTSSLLYTIFRANRYDTGSMFLLYKNNKPIAVSGCYVSDWHDSVMIVGSRTYTISSERTEYWHGKYLLPAQKELAIIKNSNMMLMSFEQDSLNVYKFIKRCSERKMVVPGYPSPDFYKEFIALPGSYIIKNTPQKIAISMLNNSTMTDLLPKEHTDVSSLG
jgi:hypothetical protein